MSIVPENVHINYHSLSLSLIHINHLVKTIINYPFGNGFFYHLFMMIWGLVYGIILTTLHNTLQKRSVTSHHQGHIPSEIATVQCTARRVRIRRRRLPLTRAPSPFTVSFLAFRVASSSCPSCQSFPDKHEPRNFHVPSA